MEFEINKADCVENLHIMSAHLGMKLGAPELVASTDDDDEKIASMWDGALSELLQLLSPYAQMQQDDNIVKITLNMPSNWKESLCENLSAQCLIYLRQSLFARWLDFVKADTAMLYRTLNQNIASAITHIISIRKKPGR